MLRKHIFIPGNIPSARKYLFGVRRLLFECADVYLPALNFFMLAREHFGVPQNILAFPQKFIHCTKIYSNPENICPVPEIYCISRADFRFFPFSSFWDCRIALIMKMIHCWQLRHYSRSLKCHIM